MSERAAEQAMETTWGRSYRAALCPQCDWQYLLPAGVRPERCPHCFRAALTPLNAATEAALAHPPELVLPFTLSRERLDRRVTAFAEGIPSPPEDLNAEALRARLQALYLPMWLVDVEVAALWRGEAGFDYEVVSHQSRYSDRGGGWAERAVQETRVRWEPRLGRLQRRYENVAAPALAEARALRATLGEFELGAAQPYQPQQLEQALLRLPNRTPTAAWPEAEPAVRAAAADECRAATEADHFREFQWRPRYANPNWTLLLLPVYTTYYRDDAGEPQAVLIHGRTGQLTGARRASMKRAQKMALIIAAVAVAIFVVSLVLAAAGLVAPPLVVVGGIGVVVAIIVGLAALAPIVRAWQFNRRETGG